jgi:hypothetical protein
MQGRISESRACANIQTIKTDSQMKVHHTGVTQCQIGKWRPNHSQLFLSSADKNPRRKNGAEDFSASKPPQKSDLEAAIPPRPAKNSTLRLPD